MNATRYSISASLLSLILSILISPSSSGQTVGGFTICSSETVRISGGGEMNRLPHMQLQAGVQGAVSSPAAPLAKTTAGPALSISFDAVNFDTNATITGYYQIPPDPIGAAGPSNVVCMVNTTIQWFTKAGVLVGQKRLGNNGSTATGSFFETLSPLTSTFDPKVIYDQYAGRFVAVALEQTETPKDPANTSRIFLAVSASGDPTGTWYFLAINSVVTIGHQDCWADYPGLAVDDKAVYVTANMFSFSSGQYADALLWIIDKGISGGLYGGGTAAVNRYSPPDSVGQSATTMQPTHMFGTVPGGMGTFLVRYSGYSSGGNELLSIIRVDNPLTTPVFSHQFVTCGNIDNTGVTMPNAPQLGTTTLIATNDRRCLNAAWRNNRLYVSTTLVPPSGPDVGQATAHWFNVNTTTLASLVLADQGNIGGEDIATGTYTYFPWIAVDPSDNLGIGFCASAPTIYAGAYFTGRFSSDPAGTNRGSGVLRAGVDYYIRTFGSGSNRWGDFTGASIDPSDGSFWFFNQYAMTRGTPLSGSSDSGRWATAFGNLSSSALPIEIASFSGRVDDSRNAVLEWATVSEVDNFGFEVQKSTEALTGYVTIPNSFVPGHGTTNVRQSYSFRDVTAKEGLWYYRLKQADLDGTLHYTEGFRLEIPATSVTIEIPTVVSLAQNFPNPFNPTTMIRYSLPSDLQVDLQVYNALGETVADLVHGMEKAGSHEVSFGSTSLSSGIYFCRLKAGGTVQTRRLLLLR